MSGSATSLADARSYVVGFSEGDSQDVRHLGGKGAGLVRLVGLGLSVPPGFVVSCRTGVEYLEQRRIPDVAMEGLRAHLAALEAETGRRFGDGNRPLLVSVRSGAPVSMPGMMDTVLNVGLTTETVVALAAETQDPAFAWDCYARFAESYARIVRGVPADDVELRLLDLELTGRRGEERARAVVDAMQELMTTGGGAGIPDDPREQINEAIEAVFGSWNSPRARAYRRFRGIDSTLGTAAVVQTMVFGNRGDTSGSGVAFTRDPSTGAAGAFGDFLFNAQGEEVVDGSRDPAPLADLGRVLPETLSELERSLRTIEHDARDLCEVEFTVEDGRLWILQTRVGQRSGGAAVRAAVEFVDEALIDRREAVARVTPAQAEAAGAPAFAAAPDPDAVVMRGVGASPGAAIGTVVFEIDDAVELAARGEDVILVRPTTSPSDVAGFIAAAGIVTGRGGRTSHAAVVARGMGRPAVCGVGDVVVAADGASASVAGRTITRGEVLSLDGTRGTVATGALDRIPNRDQPLLERLLRWCEQDLRVGPISASATDADTLVLDDPKAMSATQADAALSSANELGNAPAIVVSARWARAANDGLHGVSRGVAAIDDVISLPLIARALRPVGDDSAAPQT